MSIKRWILLCSVVAVPCVGPANLLIYLGPPDATSAWDQDGDSLPDAWERTYFGDLSATGSEDTDRDGVNNADEYQRGTIPTDSLSCTVTLFVSQATGNVSYDGLARTYDGVHGPKPTINTALSHSFPGDTVHVLGGTYTENVNIADLDITVTGEGLLKGVL